MTFKFLEAQDLGQCIDSSPCKSAPRILMDFPLLVVETFKFTEI